MSDVPALNTAQDWVTVDEVAWVFEKWGVRPGEAILNAAIRSGQVPVRGKNADNPVYEELPEADRREVMKDFSSRRGMADFQVDWIGLRSFLMQQQQISNVGRLPAVMDRQVSLAHLVPPTGRSAARIPGGSGPRQPGHGWWQSDLDPPQAAQEASGETQEAETAQEYSGGDDSVASARRGRRTE